MSGSVAPTDPFSHERMYGPPPFCKPRSVLARSRRRECIRPVGMRRCACLRPLWDQRAAGLVIRVGLQGPIRSAGSCDAARRWWPYPPLPSRTRARGAEPVGSGGRVIAVVAGHDRPSTARGGRSIRAAAGISGCPRGEAGELGREGDRGDVGVRPGLQPLQPAAEPVVAADRHPLERAGRMHQQPAQIAVAVPGDAQEPGFAAVLCWRGEAQIDRASTGPRAQAPRAPGCGRRGTLPHCCRPPPPKPSPASARRRECAISRWLVSSCRASARICSSKAAIGWSTARHCARRHSISWRSVAPSSSAWSSNRAGSAFSSVRRPRATGSPRSSRKPRIWLISAVRIPTSRSRARCSACTSSCAVVLIGTNRICGRCTASRSPPRRSGRSCAS